MDISTIAATIYFVGIAAVVTAPPPSEITKSVIFPEASYEGDYGGTPLMPHVASLNLRLQDFAPGTPADFCQRIGGTINTVSVCIVPLNGARLWLQTTQALTEDDYFRRMPSFLQYNQNAMNLPDTYGGVDPQFVAARFDISGGSLSGCNKGSQYIVSLSTPSTAGEITLFLEQSDRTVRVILKKDAVVALENKPLDDGTMTSSSTMPMSHFGWYYKMNGRYVSLEADPIARPTTGVTGPPSCASTIPTEVAAASAECSVVNYP